MRRPTFDRWVKRECCRIAGTGSFSLPKLAALAQSPRAGSSDRVSRKRLAAALHLYAIANGCSGRLHAYVYDEALRERLRKAELCIGSRDIGRLALRGTPLLALPPEYRDVLANYEKAYHAPERAAREKAELQAESRRLQLELGASSADIARAVGAPASGVAAFLAGTSLSKVSLNAARAIRDHLAEQRGGLCHKLAVDKPR